MPLFHPHSPFSSGEVFVTAIRTASLPWRGKGGGGRKGQKRKHLDKIFHDFSHVSRHVMLHAALHGDGFKEQSLYSWFVERLAEQLGPPSTSRRLVKADGKGGRGKRIEWGGSRRVSRYDNRNPVREEWKESSGRGRRRRRRRVGERTPGDLP